MQMGGHLAFMGLVRQEKPKKKGEEASSVNRRGRRAKKAESIRKQKKEVYIISSQHTRLHWHWELRRDRSYRTQKAVWNLFYLIFDDIGSYSHTIDCLLHVSSCVKP